MDATKIVRMGVFALVLVAGCGKREAPPAPAVLLPPAAASVSASAAPVKAAVAPVPAASTDPDAPTALPALLVKGVGIKKNLSYYYAFNAGAGTIKLTTTAKNAPSGVAQALQFALYDSKANRLCFDAHGNTNADKTIVLNCVIDKAQPLILRLDLGEDTIDYSVALDGPVTLLPARAAEAAVPAAGPGSTDIDAPTRLSGNRIKGEGINKPVSYYYAFNAGPGELTVTGDARNTPAAMAEALAVTLQTLRSERICQLVLGNTTIDKRVVITCKLDQRQPVILRVDLAAETVNFRVKFEGPHDFDAFALPKDVTIALDSAVLFDTAKSELKPEARKTLHEAAERVKKFAGAAVTISGHTDNVGKEASNLALSEKRAAAVRDYFVSAESVSAGTMTVQGLGTSQPVADNASEQGRARNRRVDVVIVPATR